MIRHVVGAGHVKHLQLVPRPRIVGSLTLTRLTYKRRHSVFLSGSHPSDNSPPNEPPIRSIRVRVTAGLHRSGIAFGRGRLLRCAVVVIAPQRPEEITTGIAGLPRREDPRVVVRRRLVSPARLKHHLRERDLPASASAAAAACNAAANSFTVSLPVS